jgi:hypothetical protein
MGQKTKWIVGNSCTKVELHDDWLVLDVGSGHQPHPRADVLLDRYLRDDTSRSGASMVIRRGKMICADAERIPFADNTFDFVIASSIAEHMPNPVAFCRELTRVGKRGYLETPSRFTETTRGAPYHLWYVSVTPMGLVFEPASKRKRDGLLGELYYHFCTFGRPWMHDSWLNVPNPFLRYIFRVIGFVLRRIPILLSKDLAYTRLNWTDSFEAVQYEQQVEEA